LACFSFSLIFFFGKKFQFRIEKIVVSLSARLQGEQLVPDVKVVVVDEPENKVEHVTHHAAKHAVKKWVDTDLEEKYNQIVNVNYASKAKGESPPRVVKETSSNTFLLVQPYGRIASQVRLRTNDAHPKPYDWPDKIFAEPDNIFT
jgi:hypothetical protein